MHEIKQLLGRITELDDLDIEKRRGLVLDASDASSADPARVHGIESAEQVESPAAAATPSARRSAAASRTSWPRTRRRACLTTGCRYSAVSPGDGHTPCASICRGTSAGGTARHWAAALAVDPDLVHRLTALRSSRAPQAFTDRHPGDRRPRSCGSPRSRHDGTPPDTARARC